VLALPEPGELLNDLALPDEVTRDATEVADAPSGHVHPRRGGSHGLQPTGPRLLCLQDRLDGLGEASEGGGQGLEFYLSSICYLRRGWLGWRGAREGRRTLPLYRSHERGSGPHKDIVRRFVDVGQRIWVVGEMVDQFLLEALLYLCFELRSRPRKNDLDCS
jgi:hypothetical protein